MRHLLFALSLAIALPAAARPDEVSDLKDKALKAAAKDPADLKKFRSHTLKARGISRLSPEPTAATFELAAVWPGQFRATWEFGPPGGAKNGITLIASDDKGWEKQIGLATADLSVEKLNDLRSDAYAYWVSTLTTLNDAETRLSAGGTSKVGDDAVVGLKVSRRAYPDVVLYFDEKSGVLRKMTYRSRDAGVTSNKEMIYEGHKEAHGLTLPTRQTTLVQGREIYSWVAMEYGFPEKLDPKTFEKP
jgi:hypothetical protein